MIAKGVSMKALLENSQNDNNFTLKEAINEAKRCLNCSKPLCRIGCPIENEIPAFIKELANGNTDQQPIFQLVYAYKEQAFKACSWPLLAAFLIECTVISSMKENQRTTIFVGRVNL